jgi:adenosylcobinamide amidohydrolase
VLGGGQRRADTLINHQVMLDDKAATEHPRQYLARLTKLLRLDPKTVVAMMTGADVRKTGYATARRGDWAVGAWCTAGCSNALRIGDPATAGMAPGTINLAVVINQRLSWAAMAEALAMATEARVAAVQAAGITSTRTKRPATGTGTDCIVVASSSRGRSHQYCGNIRYWANSSARPPCAVAPAPCAGLKVLPSLPRSRRSQSSAGENARLVENRKFRVRLAGIKPSAIDRLHLC